MSLKQRLFFSVFVFGICFKLHKCMRAFDNNMLYYHTALKQQHSVESCMPSQPNPLKRESECTFPWSKTLQKEIIIFGLPLLDACMYKMILTIFAAHAVIGLSIFGAYQLQLTVQVWQVHAAIWQQIKIEWRKPANSIDSSTGKVRTKRASHRKQ